MRSRRILTTLLSTVLLLTVATPSGAAIRFDKIRYDPAGKDTRSNAQLRAEFVVLKNTGDTPRHLGGWRLRDRTGYVYRIPQGFRLQPGRIVRIRTGKGSNDGNDLYWQRGWYVWNNDKDRATLKNRTGTVVDRCVYNDGSTRQNGTTAPC
jgi:hypothetical protein